ncbi:MAG: phosphatidate cytidylyltransferase [Alistipes sp.]|nr:phosphatidate cytidylyltransferase [Alistipes sp.]
MKKNPAFNTLAVRTLSGLVIAAVVAGAVLLSHYTFIVLLAVIGVGALREFYSIAELAHTEPQKRMGMIVAVAIILLFSASHFVGFLRTIGWAVMIALFFIIFISELYRKKENPLMNISATVAGIMYIALPLSLLTNIGTVSGPYTPYVILAYIVIVWANDVGAYLVGVAFGKHRLFERISPKKSWEGFFGGLLFAVGFGLLSGWLLEGDLHTMPFWAGLAAVVVLSGVCVELVESMLKRSVAIKDSGAAIPGHGGFLDRFDALLFSVPFVYLYFVIFAAH